MDNLYFIAGLILSAAIGLSLGLIGGGGSIITVPVLVYVIGVDVRESIGMSLAVVGSTSLVGATLHYRRGTLRIGRGLLFGAAGIAGAFLGVPLTRLVAPGLLLLIFALLMLVVATLMLVRRQGGDAEIFSSRGGQKITRALLAGFVVGVLTGFLGVGGGFLVVPALVLFGGLAMKEAVGTSLLVIAINCAAGLVGHLRYGGFDPHITMLVTTLAVAGALAGTHLSHRVSPAGLRKIFALFVIMVALFLVAKNYSALFPRWCGEPRRMVSFAGRASPFRAVEMMNGALPVRMKRRPSPLASFVHHFVGWSNGGLLWIAHELNNPAAAARRAADELLGTLAELRAADLRLCRLNLSSEQRRAIAEFEQRAIAQTTAAPTMTALKQSDREDDITAWLDGRGIEAGWKHAPALVEAGVAINDLEGFGAKLGAGALGDALARISAQLASAKLTSDLKTSAGRISELVGAIKEYSYMDRAAVGGDDLREALENTLLTLKHKLREKPIAVTREFAADVPKVTAFGSELNQVWTNLIDNAIDAMPNGGKIRFESKPGDTCFQVRRPLTPGGVTAAAPNT